jgi:hypothetical protein
VRPLLEQGPHVRPLVHQAGQLQQLTQPDPVVSYLDFAHPHMVACRF